MVTEEKIQSREGMAALRDRLRKEPRLSYLFFELTDRCNLRCRHCGSACGEKGSNLRTESLLELIGSVPQRAPDAHLVLTGGEPLLHPDFEIIAAACGEKGLIWSLVTNATLIDALLAKKLRQWGIASVSVSLDGDERRHNYLRRSDTAYTKALKAVELLKAQGIPVQLTTVITKHSLSTLDEMYQRVRAMGARSWKIVNVEPIGRALGNEELLLSRDELLRLLDFIRLKREKGHNRSGELNITYGCSHFLPLMYEQEVRQTPFICGAGIMIAGIQCSGDIAGCLDIERRAGLVQGNIYRDDFWRVWETGFEPFRRDRTEDSTLCSSCRLRHYCGGDSMHTWDFDAKRPRICFMRDTEKAE